MDSDNDLFGHGFLLKAEQSLNVKKGTCPVNDDARKFGNIQERVFVHLLSKYAASRTNVMGSMPHETL
jgi:hypothetical protein